jgi:hypothetical protein
MEKRDATTSAKNAQCFIAAAVSGVPSHFIAAGVQHAQKPHFLMHYDDGDGFVHSKMYFHDILYSGSNRDGEILFH